jgi:hypothetical protein
VATTPVLRPLSVGEILDAGIKLYTRHWKTLALCALGIALPLQILAALILASADPKALEISFDTSGSSGDELGTRMLLLLIALAGGVLATAACFVAVADAWLGRTPDARRSLRAFADRAPAVAGLLVAIAIGLALGSIGLFVPTVWLGVSWLAAVPALMFEQLGPIAALRRSFRLVRNRWWPTFGTFLVAWILTAIVGIAVQVPPALVAQAIAPDSTLAVAIGSAVGGTISSAITMPYLAIVCAFLYFDLRVRKEGFDVQSLAEGPGKGSTAPAPEPEPVSPEPDPQRVEWLPPEAPRGPGGL